MNKDTPADKSAEDRSIPSRDPASLSRAALADWIASPKNPLTARVMVNRIWQHHFGRGIVATPSDFGTHGAKPTHPELLDWLASEFIARGWSVKQMHRVMLSSATYRQGSVLSAQSSVLSGDRQSDAQRGIKPLSTEQMQAQKAVRAGVQAAAAVGRATRPQFRRVAGTDCRRRVARATFCAHI